MLTTWATCSNCPTAHRIVVARVGTERRRLGSARLERLLKQQSWAARVHSLRAPSGLQERCLLLGRVQTSLDSGFIQLRWFQSVEIAGLSCNGVAMHDCRLTCWPFFSSRNLRFILSFFSVVAYHSWAIQLVAHYNRDSAKSPVVFVCD